jgi:glutaredoxin
LVKKLLVYTHPDCGHSEALKAELQSEGTEYDEIDLSISPEAWSKLEALTDGDRITPVTVEGEVVTIGFHGVG